jgi:O-antigen ligase
VTRVSPFRIPHRQYLVDASRPAGYLISAIVLGILLTWLPLKTAVLLVAGVAIFLLILIHPLLALALALLAGPFGALENVVLGTSLPESGQLLFFLAVAAWLGRGAIRRRIWVPRTALTVPLLLFLTIATISLFNARSLDYGLKELTKWIEMGLIMFMVVDLASETRAGHLSSHLSQQRVASRKARRTVLAMLLLAGLSQAIIGIWQFGLRGDGPEHFEILDRFYRAYGTFEQPNPFGGFMAITAGLAVGVLFGLLAGRFEKARAGERWLSGDWMWTAFVAICAVLTTTALLASWSRGAWLGFIISLGTLLLFLPKRRWFGVLLLLILIVIALISMRINVMPASIVERVGSFRDDLSFSDVRGEDINDANYAVLERLAHWQAAVNMAQDNLLLGVGFGNYEPAYDEYALLNWPYPLGHAHNYYLNILAETGILGILAYLLFWAAVFVQLIKLLGKLSWPQRGIALGLLTAWTALAAHNLVDKLYVNNLFIYLGVMLGLQQLLDLGDDNNIR